MKHFSFTFLYPSFVPLSADHKDRPDCSQNPIAGFPGVGGLGWLPHGGLLCR